MLVKLKKVQYVNNIVEEEEKSTTMLMVGSVSVPHTRSTGRVNESTDIRVLLTVDNFENPIIEVGFKDYIGNAEKMIYLLEKGCNKNFHKQ